MLFFILAQQNISDPQFIQNFNEGSDSVKICIFDNFPSELYLGKNCRLEKPTWFNSGSSRATINEFTDKFEKAVKLFRVSDSKGYASEYSLSAFLGEMKACANFEDLKPEYSVLCQDEQGFNALLKFHGAKSLTSAFYGFNKYKNEGKTKSGSDKNNIWTREMSSYVDIEKYSRDNFRYKNLYPAFYDQSGPVFFEAVEACSHVPNNYPGSLLSKFQKTTEDAKKIQKICSRYYPESFFEKPKGYYENSSKTLYDLNCKRSLLISPEKQSSEQVVISNETYSKENELSEDNSKLDSKSKKTSKSSTQSKQAPSLKESISTGNQTVNTNKSISSSNPGVPLPVSPKIEMPPTTVSAINSRDKGIKTMIEGINASPTYHDQVARVELYKNLLELHKQERLQEAKAASKTFPVWNDPDKQKTIIDHYDGLIKDADQYLKRKNDDQYLKQKTNIEKIEPLMARPNSNVIETVKQIPTRSPANFDSKNDVIPKP